MARTEKNLMARIRTIKPEFWVDEKIVDLSAFARLLFIGLWNFADDDGRMICSPRKIKMQIFPADNLDISGLLGELRGGSLINIYTIDNVEYLQLNNFHKHQKIDKRTPSKLPPFPGSPELPRTPPTDSKGMEGNGKDLLASSDAKQNTTSKSTIKRKRAQDPIWGTLLEVCGLSGANPTPTERGAWNKAVQALKAVDATPAEIQARAAAYRKKWPQVSLTPSALARRWNECVAKAAGDKS